MRKSRLSLHCRVCDLAHWRKLEMTYLTNSLEKQPKRWSQSLLLCLFAGGVLLGSLAGCASKPKPPSTVKEFLGQPRPK
ncbi:MAG: hypothetical protein ACREHD_11650 [Pirellulales bacterium]